MIGYMVLSLVVVVMCRRAWGKSKVLDEVMTPVVIVAVIVAALSVAQVFFNVVMEILE